MNIIAGDTITLSMDVGGSELTFSLVTGVGEAPVDGSEYVRKNAAWSVSSGALDTTAIHKTTSAEISALTDKTTPIDADVILGENSANAYSKIKITWANIKATLKSYFDIIYTNPANITQSASYRFVTDTQKAAYNKESIIAACSDETTALTIGTSKISFTAPYALTITSVKADVNTAPTGANLIVDINKNTVTILSTKITIEATEFSSLDATTQPVISVNTLAAGDILTIDIDQVGATIAGKGLKVTIECTKS